MPLPVFHEPQAFAPDGHLTAELAIDATEITFSGTIADSFPQRAVLRLATDDGVTYETVLLPSAPVNGKITGITRAVEGTARVWPVGSPICCALTAAGIKDLQTGETDLQSQITNISLTPGPTGADGKSAYQVWLDAGNTGTEAEFLISLKGAKGDTGDPGTNGTDGKEVEFQKTDTEIQWRYVGNTSWATLCLLSAITGPAGGTGAVAIWTDITESIQVIPASGSTITTVSDLTGAIKAGYALKITIAGVVSRAIVKSITSTTITILGAPMSGTITAIQWATDKDAVIWVPFLIPGAYADSTNSALINSNLRIPGGFIWEYGPAHGVGWRVVHMGNDTGAIQPTIYPLIGGVQLGTGISVSTSRADSGVGITPANSTLIFGTLIEIAVTAGTNRNAYDLFFELAAVRDI